MDIKSQIQAVVWKINVKIGDKVNEGQEIIILESMKMEIPKYQTYLVSLKVYLLKKVIL